MSNQTVETTKIEGTDFNPAIFLRMESCMDVHGLRPDLETMGQFGEMLERVGMQIPGPRRVS
jgi:hypothetical protein